MLTRETAYGAGPRRGAATMPKRAVFRELAPGPITVIAAHGFHSQGRKVEERNLARSRPRSLLSAIGHDAAAYDIFAAHQRKKCGQGADLMLDEVLPVIFRKLDDSARVLGLEPVDLNESLTRQLASERHSGRRGKVLAAKRKEAIGSETLETRRQAGGRHEEHMRRPNRRPIAHGNGSVCDVRSVDEERSLLSAFIAIAENNDAVERRLRESTADHAPITRDEGRLDGKVALLRRKHGEGSLNDTGPIAEVSDPLALGCESINNHLSVLPPLRALASKYLSEWAGGACNFSKSRVSVRSKYYLGSRKAR